MSGANGFTADTATTLVGTVNVALNPGQDRSVIVIRDLAGDEIARLNLTPLQGLQLARGLVQAGQMAAALGAAQEQAAARRGVLNG
jgi:hypothetical protein